MGSNFLTATAAAESHDVNKVAELNALRPLVELHVAGAVQWAVIRSTLENNSNLIANLPVQAKKKPVRSASSAGVHAPQNPKVKHGIDSGTVIVGAGKVEKARAYYVSFCTGDPSVEASWTIMGPFDSCRRMEVSGLEPGKLYYFRVSCFGKGVMSPWSEIITPENPVRLRMPSEKALKCFRAFSFSNETPPLRPSVIPAARSATSPLHHALPVQVMLIPDKVVSTARMKTSTPSGKKPSRQRKCRFTP